jgi:XTP/dITP diphosphohydrolase
VPEAEEPHPTFVENALTKARHAAKLTGLPALADDSGLCVRALFGAPGVYSARFAQLAGGEKSDAANNALLVERLKDEADRRAYYYCVLALVRHADDPEPLIAEGRWHGVVLDAPRGANGFGYDPYFFLPELNATAAELDPAVKNASSHRAKALKHLLARLKEDA